MEIQKEYRFKDEAAWKNELQKNPKPEYIKERDLGGNRKSRYIPLFVQEALADIFFRQCNVTEEKYQMICNELLCTVTIHLLPDYPGSEMEYITGTGAKPIQQVKNSSPAAFPEGKISNSLEYNAPAARAAAKSNALTSYANVFGRNLGRKTKDNFSFIRKKEQEPEK